MKQIFFIRANQCQSASPVKFRRTSKAYLTKVAKKAVRYG